MLQCAVLRSSVLCCSAARAHMFGSSGLVRYAMLYICLTRRSLFVVRMEFPCRPAWDSNLRPPASESRPLTNWAVGATNAMPCSLACVTQGKGHRTRPEGVCLAWIPFDSLLDAPSFQASAQLITAGQEIRGPPSGGKVAPLKDPLDRTPEFPSLILASFLQASPISFFAEPFQDRWSERKTWTWWHYHSNKNIVNNDTDTCHKNTTVIGARQRWS